MLRGAGGGAAMLCGLALRRVLRAAAQRPVALGAQRRQALDECRDAPQRRIVVAGTEAHVCVLHTCLDLLAHGKRVFVVADAVGSRNTQDRELALARLRQNGAQVVSREMVAFEWLQRAGTDLFRRINRELIR